MANILNFSIDAPYASALARKARGMLTASIGSEMERLQVVALLRRPRQWGRQVDVYTWRPI